MNRILVIATAFASALVACSAHHAESSAPPVSEDAGTREAPFVAQHCAADVEDHGFQLWRHVPIGSEITYGTNPPCGGDHYPTVQAYGVYDTPVSRGAYVHNLEHGAIVLLYKCATQEECDYAVRGLKMVADALSDDPMCDPARDHTTKRVLITPDPLLDTPFAAASWGWTYTAPCLDLDSMIAFARDRYGKGREATCVSNVTM